MKTCRCLNAVEAMEECHLSNVRMAWKQSKNAIETKPLFNESFKLSEANLQMWNSFCNFACKTNKDDTLS